MKKARFPFKEKEGKFFAPIVGVSTKKSIVDGVVTSRSVPKAGVKGVFAKVRLTLPVDVAGDKVELYAISSEAFISSK